MLDGPTETLIRRGSYPLEPMSRRTVDAGSYGISWPAPGCWGRRVDHLNVSGLSAEYFANIAFTAALMSFKFRGRNVDRRVDPEAKSGSRLAGSCSCRASVGCQALPAFFYACHGVFFSPRNIVETPSGQVNTSAPLLVEYITMVFSSRPSSLSLSEHLAHLAVVPRPCRRRRYPRPVSRTSNPSFWPSAQRQLVTKRRRFTFVRWRSKGATCCSRSSTGGGRTSSVFAPIAVTMTCSSASTRATARDLELFRRRSEIPKVGEALRIPGGPPICWSRRAPPPLPSLEPLRPSILF
jgi:hypothetical protein